MRELTFVTPLAARPKENGSCTARLFDAGFAAMDLNVLWWDLERLERDLRRAHTRDRPQDPHGLIDRVGNIRTALRQSTSIAGQTPVARLAGIDLSGILGILLDACRDIALYWGGSVLAGGAAGAGVGFFVGGVGAFPGAAIGAAAGAQAGAWVLGLLGLASLVEGLGTALGHALSCYASGIENAWGPTEWHPHRFPARAPHDFARGHEILAMALLAAIAAYLSRGRGDKQKLLQEIRQSPRLGPKVAIRRTHDQQGRRVETAAHLPKGTPVKSAMNGIDRLLCFAHVAPFFPFGTAAAPLAWSLAARACLAACRNCDSRSQGSGGCLTSRWKLPKRLVPLVP